MINFSFCVPHFLSSDSTQLFLYSSLKLIFKFGPRVEVEGAFKSMYFRFFDPSFFWREIYMYFGVLTFLPLDTSYSTLSMKEDSLSSPRAISSFELYQETLVLSDLKLGCSLKEFRFSHSSEHWVLDSFLWETLSPLSLQRGLFSVLSVIFILFV